MPIPKLEKMPSQIWWPKATQYRNSKNTRSERPQVLGCNAAHLERGPSKGISIILHLKYIMMAPSLQFIDPEGRNPPTSPVLNSFAFPTLHFSDLFSVMDSYRLEFNPCGSNLRLHHCCRPLVRVRNCRNQKRFHRWKVYRSTVSEVPSTISISGRAWSCQKPVPARSLNEILKGM